MRNLEKRITERIRAILQTKGINQTELADRAGIAQGYLNELMNLNPRKRWNADHLEKVVKALDVPPWQLFIDPAEVIPNNLLDLASRYSRLRGDDKRIVDAMLTAAAVEPSKPRTVTKKRAAT